MSYTLKYTGPEVEKRLEQAGNAANEIAAARAGYGTIGEAMEAISSNVDEVQKELENYVDAKAVDGLYYEDSKLYLTSNGEIVSDPIEIVSGSGGGGAGAAYTVALVNLLESRTMTVAGGSAAELKFKYTSTDEYGNDDGSGVGSVIVNGVQKATFNVQQGVETTINISEYLTSGLNTVKLKVENSEGLYRTLVYTINVISLSITTAFDDMAMYTDDIIFNYTVTGSGDKTVHILMDGVEIGTEKVASSGRSRSYDIPAQTVGAHTLTVYAEVSVNDVTVRSNALVIGMMWVSEDMSAPAIISTFTQTEATQGEIISIPYMVYDPLNESASIVLSILDADGGIYSAKNITVDRTRQEWTVQDYPEGEVTFRISCGSASLNKIVAVTANSIVIEPVTDALVLYFDPSGRSNAENAPAAWTDGNVNATFNGIGFSAVDGWLTDNDGAALLRLLPGSEMSIPFKPFETDARATGYTIEVEMATHNVRDYDTTVLSCLSDGRGMKIATQYAGIYSEQSALTMQFKEDEKVRLSFVVESRYLNRMIYVYADGIMCGAMQYPENDNFAQSPAVGLSIGAEAAGIDIYRIRMYNKGLTRQEILDNYTADRPLLSERIKLYERNDIFDFADDIVLSKLPVTTPYMVLKCAELPQYKGDKKTCEIEYVNQSDTARSFKASNVQIDVQGTSSAGYKKKNFKIKLQNGVTYTASGTHTEKYQLRSDSLPVTVYCMKADVASSEGTNNVELVRLYDDTVPYKTAPQIADEKVRVGIDGLPCVIFWQNTTTNEVKFWGKYNFNFDKSASEVFGLTDGCESWEIRNNTSDRVIFKKSDFGDGWQDDFEARYPDGNTDYTKLKRLCDWIVSTDRTAVDTEDEKAERLNKFKNEFEDYFVKAPMLYYYLFTETFLMVDSRAKNFFPTTYDGVHWLPLPYDFDTAIGINNEGQLAFDYDLEDTDTVNGANVFNGQNSVLWCNVRDAFGDEIKTMYNELRSGGVFSYSEVVKRFAEHQAVWSEAVWNEDSWEKYLEPLENDGDGSYLTMLQGNKASQREWWLYNGFRYRDSKYQCGDAQSNFITLRCYAVGDITVTPYSHIYPRIKYGSYTVTKRGKRNVACLLENPLDSMDDTEVYIYSADRLSVIGDLSPVQVGYANFSMATKLQELKLGDGDTSYENTHLSELYVGNNELLTMLDVQNCSALTMTVDLSGCVGIERIKAKGSAVTGFTLPVGGKLKTMELPETVTNLTIRDQAQLESMTMAGYGALTTLRVENTPNVPLGDILSGAEKLNRVRLVNVEWETESEDVLQNTISRLKNCIGMDAAGNNTSAAVVIGRVSVPSISAELLNDIQETFPSLVVVAGGVPQYVARYINWDNTLLYRIVVPEGGDAIDPVEAGYIAAPTRTGTEDTKYVYKDFGTLPTNVQSNVYITATYTTVYRVQFKVDSTVYDNQWVEENGAAITPSGTPTKASTAQYIYTFSRWSDSYNKITKPTTVTAVFTSTVRSYNVYFYNGSTLLETVTVKYGSDATYSGDTPVKSGVDNPDDYPFEEWLPAPTNIKGETKCYAQFGSPVEDVEIEDDWETIITNIENGSYREKYKLGNYKPLDLGDEGVINMQIAAFNKDTLADRSGTAATTWIAKELLATQHRMNPRLVVYYAYPEVEAWVANHGTLGHKYYWKANNIYVKDTATFTLKLSANTSGSVNIRCLGTSISTDEFTVVMDSETIYDDNRSGSTYVCVDVTEGKEYKIVVSFTNSNKSNGSAAIAFGSSKDTAEYELEVSQMGTTTKQVITGYEEGTGTFGGWAEMELRKYLKDTVKSFIPKTINGKIKSVIKSTRSCFFNDGLAQTKSDTETVEDLWIPSMREINYNLLSGAVEQAGVSYKDLYEDSTSRMKCVVASENVEDWFTRTTNDKEYFYRITATGGYKTYDSISYPHGICLCFCI